MCSVSITVILIYSRCCCIEVNGKCIAMYKYEHRQRFWPLEFVNERLRASHLLVLLHVTGLLLNMKNAQVFCYTWLGYSTRRQGQRPRMLARPIPTTARVKMILTSTGSAWVREGIAQQVAETS